MKGQHIHADTSISCPGSVCLSSLLWLASDWIAAPHFCGIRTVSGHWFLLVARSMRRISPGRGTTACHTCQPRVDSAASTGIDS